MCSLVVFPCHRDVVWGLSSCIRLRCKCLSVEWVSFSWVVEYRRWACERIAFAIVPDEVRYPDRIVGIALLLWSMQ